MLAKLWGGEPQEGRSHRVSLPPHFRDDKAPSAPSQGTHCPIVHLAPEGMQPKVRRVLHQSAKPWDQVLAGSSEGIRRVPGRTENGGASPTYTRGARERSALQEASVFRLRGAPRGSQDTAELTMLLSLTLLLLMGLSTCAVAGDEELTLSAEAGSWVTVTLEEGVIPSIQLQLQEEYLPSSQREERGISEDKWSQTSWAREDHLQKPTSQPGQPSSPCFLCVQPGPLNSLGFPPGLSVSSNGCA
nr:PREDICTED: tachykinin-4 isoform X2 [Equus przewalskii]